MSRREHSIAVSRRDIEAVRLIAVHRFLTRPQLEELLLGDGTFTPRSRHVVAWRVLARLQRDGYVASTRRHAGGALGGSDLPAYFLTSNGLRLASTICPELPRRRPAVRSAFLAPHSILTTDIELAFRRSAALEPDTSFEIWEADWQLAMRLGDGAVIPDARVTLRVGTWRCHLFIEADLGTEGTRFFARKMGRYVDLHAGGAWREFIRVFPQIVTVTLTEARAASLHRATLAFMRSQYAYSALPLHASFVSIDALRAAGVRALCWALAHEAQVALLNIDELRLTSAPHKTIGVTEPRSVDAGRFGTSGRTDDQAPDATAQVDGPAR